MKIEFGHPRQPTEPERLTARSLTWEAPRLPGLAPTTVIPRSVGTATWTPPGTQLLVRHRASDGRRVVTNDRQPPRGFSVEFDLGVVHVHAHPGTRRLLAGPDGFVTTPIEGDAADDYRALGHVEDHALPMLQALELRRVPETGQLTLVCGPADPLFDVATAVGRVGFVDEYPVQPRQTKDLRHQRFATALRRRASETLMRHEYAVGPDDDAWGPALGGVSTEPSRGLVPLQRDGHGRLTTPLMELRPARRRVKDAARWTIAPTTWADSPLPSLWGVRASVGRLRRLRTAFAHEDVGRAAAPLAYLLAQGRPGWSALYSTTHPVTGDQYLTRSELEATDMGYVVDGLLGYVADDVAASREDLLAEILWASHFGQRRRYVEGGSPGSSDE